MRRAAAIFWALPALLCCWPGVAEPSRHQGTHNTGRTGPGAPVPSSESTFPSEAGPAVAGGCKCWTGELHGCAAVVVSFLSHNCPLACAEQQAQHAHTGATCRCSVLVCSAWALYTCRGCPRARDQHPRCSNHQTAGDAAAGRCPLDHQHLQGHRRLHERQTAAGPLHHQQFPSPRRPHNTRPAAGSPPEELLC